MLGGPLLAWRWNLLHQNHPIMATRSFIRRLEVKLDEVFFVFWQLPKQLNSASKRLGLHALRSDVLARAQALQARAAKLLLVLQKWGGRKPYPCDCPDLAVELNELRHAAKTPAPEHWLYRRAMRIADKLNHMVRERLVQARRLAVLLGEQVLAADINALLKEERESAAELGKVQGGSMPADGS